MRRPVLKERTPWPGILRDEPAPMDTPNFWAGSLPLPCEEVAAKAGNTGEAMALVADIAAKARRYTRTMYPLSLVTNYFAQVVIFL
jgi:hypothetical protein